MLVKGAHKGSGGTIEEIKKDVIIYKNSESRLVETPKEFVFVMQ